MSEPHVKTITEYWPKPIPMRGYDWSAVTDNYEPGCPIGYGATEHQAIAELIEQMAECAA